MRVTTSIVFSVVLSLVSTVSFVQQGLSDTATSAAVAVSEDGGIRVPDVDFRKDWTQLGTWAIASDDGVVGAKAFHAVYVQPEIVAAYRETGTFPDGTILVKELLTTSTAEMTTGTVNYAGEVSGWFVMVKDANDKFAAKNGLWGNGWGWAYFDAGNRFETSTNDYKAECLGCHIPAKDTDWVFVEGYPVLNAKQ